MLSGLATLREIQLTGYMDILARLIAWLNAGMNGLFGLLHGPMSALPAWLSLTIVSALLGVVLLVIFKYTSPQKAIGRVRDDIKANLLAMKLFKDNIPVILKSQGRVLAAAVMLLVYSIPPILVMALPFVLILGQLGTWYQAEPLDTEEQAVVMMQLSGRDNASMPPVALVSNEAIRIVSGPVSVPAKGQIFWEVEALLPGIHQLQFQLEGAVIEKELAAGIGFMPVSIKRPSMKVGDVILYPAERPFGPDSPVQSVEIRYPERTAPLTGSGNWVITLFIISMLGAFAVKPFFNVRI